MFSSVLLLSSFFCENREAKFPKKLSRLCERTFARGYPAERRSGGAPGGDA
jgi:hypothetical protein